MKIPELIEKNKSVFGTYAAMALMNIQTVLNHIQKLAAIEGALQYKSENYWEHPVVLHLNNSFHNDKYPEKTRYIMEKLLHSFPFLKIMAENQRMHSNSVNKQNRLEINSADIYHILNRAFRVLKKYRDHTCHYMIADSSWNDGSPLLRYNEQILAIVMNKYYDVALRNVKEKYCYSTADLAFIQDHRYKKTTGSDGKRRTIADYSFFLSILNDNEDKTGKKHLSGAGVALLISLFLEKKYINVFLSKLHLNGKYPASSEQSKVIKRSFCINSIKLPRERIKSDKKGMAIALDMLNELKRCPTELFDTLSFSDQARFRVLSSDHNEVLQMRSTNRFAQMMLQYIDYNHLFDGIRFHVNMGKLRYLFSPDKKCVDGERRVRVIEHQLNGFGRIDEMEYLRKNTNGNFSDTNVEIRDFENVTRDDADSNNYPYIVDTYTHYILNNNKIELCFNDDKIVPGIVEFGGKWYVDKKAPDCRLSTLELPAMMFHMYLLGSDKTEACIKNVYNNYKKMFQALSEGLLTKENIDSFGIVRADMPQKVIDAVNGVTTGKNYTVYAKKLLGEMLAETERRLERLRLDKRCVVSKSNKMGRPGYRQLSAGRLAGYLAKDIVRFQPTLCTGDKYGTDRMTGLNYRVMQASIATFSDDSSKEGISKLKAMFKNAGLIDNKESKKNHPFLKEAISCNPRNTIEFYESYLKKKKRHLGELVKDLAQGRRPVLPFINRDSNKWLKRDADFYKVMGEIYLEDVAVELPRQMFDNEIKDALRALPEMCDIDFDNANVTYLIGEYMRLVKNDNSQSFYSLKRNYRYIDLLKCQTDSKGSLCELYTTLEEREELWTKREERAAVYKQMMQKKRRADIKMRGLSDKEFDELVAGRLAASRNEYQKSEKLIRRYKVQDILLFLLVEDLLKSHIKFNAGEFKLKDIAPDAERGILSEIMPMDFIFERNGKKYTIHSGGMKLKNYGDFFSIAHDKRLVSLLDILQTSNVDKEEIDRELDNYDTNRPKVVKLVLDFEKWAFSKYPEMRRKVTEQSHFDFSAILGELTQKKELNETETRILSQIRNAFNHNVYPYRGIVEINTLPEVANHLIDVFGRNAHIKTI